MWNHRIDSINPRGHLKRFAKDDLARIYAWQKKNISWKDQIDAKGRIEKSAAVAPNASPLLLPSERLVAPEPPFLELPPAIVNVPAAKAAYENKLLVERLTETAQLPVRQTKGAAGYDLFSDEDMDIHPQQAHVVMTNIRIQLPSFTYGRIAPRSGLAALEGVDVLAGVIDEDYRGSINVILIKHSPGIFSIKKGMRIAQLIIERIALPEIEEVGHLSETKRGVNGFGSTGR